MQIIFESDEGILRTGMAGAGDLFPATTKNETPYITMPSAEFHINRHGRNMRLGSGYNEN